MRVEPRFVRRTRFRCWFLRLPGLPNRESSPAAPPPTAFTGEVSDDRRARALGPSEGRVTERVSSECCRSIGCVALVAHADNRSPPQRPKEHPTSPARSFERGETHSQRRRAGQDRRSTATPRRATASRRSGCFSPQRSRRRNLDHSRCLPASVSRSRRPHVLHGLWRGAL